MKVINTEKNPERVSLHSLPTGTAFAPTWDTKSIYVKVSPGLNLMGVPGAAYALNVATNVVTRFADASDPCPVYPKSEVTIQTNAWA